jgi:hypothetical protein
MAYEILELIQQHSHIQEVRQEVREKAKEKRYSLKKLLVGRKLNGEVREKIVNLKDTVENLVGEIENLSYSPYDGKLNKIQYAYYYLLNTKQVVKDFFPKYVQKVLLPKLEEDIAITKLKIDKLIVMEKGETEKEREFYIVLRDYLSQYNPSLKIRKEVKKIKQIALPIDKFRMNLDREMLKIQAKEEKYFGKELEPMPPKRKTLVYILDVKKLLGEKSFLVNLKDIEKVLISYIEGKPIIPNEESNYEYYIEMLKGNKSFIY